MKNWYEETTFEHQFWLQVLGDHARFIRDTLSPEEEEKVKQAREFVSLFDAMLERSREALLDDELITLSREAFEASQKIRTFKLAIIKEHLVGQITIKLTPTFLNHMVNEVEEYIRILGYLIQGEKAPPAHALHHHLVWLLDAAGHADGITGSLDMVEKKLKRSSQSFTKTFEEFYIKAVEMTGYLRANVTQFPALSRFNHQVELEITLFKAFLNEIEELGLTDEMLSTLSPLMADHMAREECYYLMKLAESSNISAPECNPASPRTEE
ncbi:DUF2935 domain-containing protein [Bacillus sp. FJAT-44742]|uniref:DUF2935 domain-containing protein n=1 Tax=Bacillus sp. FJAT-44742 TaxID=2014005 RepID=UPI000C248336|nr:DUF2935 domain-containing protein [Bacillus sp. FJAT-44742]